MGGDLLELLAWISIAVAICSALWIAADELRHPQSMAVMNVVWPVSGLYFSVFAVWAYYRLGRAHASDAKAPSASQRRQGAGPTAAQVAVSTSHCGAGCMLADVLCDLAIGAFGITLLGSSLWAEYAIDLGAAWALGIVFQYFSIKPMRHLTAGQALLAAVKADTLSILSFQVGMYAFMALTYFVLFSHPHLTSFDPRYWLMMQAAMICGFATSFPVNRWLIQTGLKEAM